MRAGTRQRATSGIATSRVNEALVEDPMSIRSYGTFATLFLGGMTACGDHRGSPAVSGATDAGAFEAIDTGMNADGAAQVNWTMKPIVPAAPDDCITDISAGDHTFGCSGLTFLVMVDDLCTKYACGLIF